MTEAEWVACTDPGPMLEFLRGRASDRKLRLFAVACCRRIWNVLPDERSRTGVEIAERYADGKASHPELLEAERSGGCDQTRTVLRDEAREAAVTATRAVAWAVNGTFGFRARTAELEAHTQLLRDIFGPLPFRPVTIQPNVLAWNDRLVVRLAQAIYDERRWGDMPILGDALLDAGCNDDEVMAHCRAGVGHVKGCWVADLCLGRSWERALADEHPPFGHYPPRPDAVRVVLSDGPLSGFEVGVMPPLPPVIRVNAPRHGDHRVWITHTYELRGQRYEYVKTDRNFVTACP